MTDRYTITVDKNTLLVRFNLESTEGYVPSYNAAPSHLMPVITVGSQGLSFFYWGQIPERAKNRTISQKLLNIDSKVIIEKPIEQQNLVERRCLILADGFYGWKRISKKGKVAHRVVFKDNEILGFGGMWEEFETEEGTIVHTFKIISTASNTLVQSMSGNMPLIINRESEKLWLNRETSLSALLELLNPFPTGQMSLYSVSPKVENPNYNHPSLIEPFAPADQFGNYSLFD
ncbi:MAG: SOS response-associated peptidase [Bacteroidota bacterium]